MFGRMKFTHTDRYFFSPFRKQGHSLLHMGKFYVEYLSADEQESTAS